jgi:hypothetical protein
VLFSTILFCRFLLHPKMSLEDAVAFLRNSPLILKDTLISADA